MKFQILSHAGLMVTNGRKQLVVDPWLIGSCYWRSWWNYPPAPRETIDALRPDYIYLTHIHWDHFQGPSLRLFKKETPIIVPKGNYDRMKRDLKSLGFKNVIELRHAEAFEIDTGFRFHSYQFFPWLDSAAVIDCDGQVLFDANDAKFMGWPLEQILNRHPKIDFVFRNHSSSNGRLCYEVIDDPEMPVDDDLSYLKGFEAFVVKTQARYAIPFASNHCFLAKDVFGLNYTVTTPLAVRKYMVDQRVSSPELKIMLPGDSWDAHTGFDIAPDGERFFDDRREEQLSLYRERQLPALEKHERLEERAQIRAKDFDRYFIPFRRAIPWPLRFLFKNRPFRFVLSQGSQKKIFDLDLYQGSVVEQDPNVRPQDHCLEIHSTVAIIRNCIALDLFSHLQISKRVRFRVMKHTMLQMKALNLFFDNYEYELFPLWKNFRWRSLETWALRWREILTYLKIILLFPFNRHFSYPKEIGRPRLSPPMRDVA